MAMVMAIIGGMVGVMVEVVGVKVLVQALDGAQHKGMELVMIGAMVQIIDNMEIKSYGYGDGWGSNTGSGYIPDNSLYTNLDNDRDGRGFGDGWGNDSGGGYGGGSAMGSSNQYGSSDTRNIQKI
jgi:hypothetical protein